MAEKLQTGNVANVTRASTAAKHRLAGARKLRRIRKESFRPNISPDQQSRLFMITTVLLPVAVLAFGLFNWSGEACCLLGRKFRVTGTPVVW